MKRLIMFDFFGVIGAEIFPRWFKNHFREEEAVILKDKYFEPADLGLFTLDETLDMIYKDLGYKKEDVISELKTFVKPNFELLEKITELRHKNKTALLSNASEGIFEMLYPMVDFNTYFDKAFVSYKYKMKKPSIEFYNLCVDSFLEDFDEIYFIDDNMKNIVVLKDTKIKGIQYTSNEELFKILNNFL